MEKAKGILGFIGLICGIGCYVSTSIGLSLILGIISIMLITAATSR